jgi:hypothetical protein
MPYIFPVVLHIWPVPYILYVGVCGAYPSLSPPPPRHVTIPNSNSQFSKTQYPIPNTNSQNLIAIAIAIVKNPIVLLLLLGIGCVTCLPPPRYGHVFSVGGEVATSGSIFSTKVVYYVEKIAIPSTSFGRRYGGSWGIYTAHTPSHAHVCSPHWFHSSVYFHSFIHSLTSISWRNLMNELFPLEVYGRQITSCGLYLKINAVIQSIPIVRAKSTIVKMQCFVIHSVFDLGAKITTAMYSMNRK